MLPNFGGSEHLIIFALVALLVFKPQDLPVIMKKAGQFMSSAKRMAADFRASFDDMARQSELDQLRKEVEAMRNKAVAIATDTSGEVTNAITNVADQFGGQLGDPQANAIYDPAFWMGETPAAEPAPVEAPKSKATPKTAPKPRVKPAAAKPKTTAPKTPAAKPAKPRTPVKKGPAK